MKITFNNDILTAMDFVKICSTYKSPIDLCADNHYLIDAKSIMGVSAFAGGYDLDVVIRTDSKSEEEKFKKDMNIFAID